MRTPDLLRQLTSRLAGPMTRRRGRRGPARQSGFLQVAPLESRLLPSSTGVVFDSAIEIGNDLPGSELTAATYGVTVDTAGNRYVTGTFTATVDFDLTSTRPDNSDVLTARGRDDGYVAKYRPDGALIWIAQFGSDTQDLGTGVTDRGSDITIDASGALLVSGEFSGTAAFGASSVVSMGGRDLFVAKLNSDGAFQWVRCWGTPATDVTGGVDTDSLGNVYTLSSVRGDFLEIKKFSASGTSVWSKTVVNHSGVSGGGLTVDPAGNVYVADNFRGTVDFDPSAKTKNLSSSTYSGFVLSLDTQGKFRWVSPFISTGSSGTFAAVDYGDGKLVLGGSYSGMIDMDPGPRTSVLTASAGAASAFVTKLNANDGRLVWARSVESDSFASVNDLQVDGAGNIYATGSFRGSIDLDPGTASAVTTSAGNFDIFVIKLSSAGSRLWSTTIGSSGLELSYGIAVAPSGAVSIIGIFNGTVDFDPSLTSTYILSTIVNRPKGYLLQLLQA